MAADAAAAADTLGERNSAVLCVTALPDQATLQTEVLHVKLQNDSAMAVNYTAVVNIHTLKNTCHLMT